MLRTAAGKRRGSGEAQILVNDVEQVERRTPRRDAEVVHVAAEEVDDVVALVDDHRRRKEAFQILRVDRLERIARRALAFARHALRRHRLHVRNAERGRRRIFHLPRTIVNVDLLRAACRLEHVRVFVRCLAFAQEQISPVLQGGMEDGEQTALQNRLEVDHDVAAADQVQLAERRVGQHVVRREDDHAPDFFGDVVFVVALGEEARQTLSRHVVDDALREHALACLLDSAHVDVGRKDLHITAHLQLVKHLSEQDGDRVRLFARRASRTPHANRLVLVSLLHDVVDDVALEDLEMLRVAEKARHADKNLFDQDVDLFERPSVLRKTVAVRHDDTALDTAQDRAALVIGEVDAAFLLQHHVNVGKAFLVREERFVRIRQKRQVIMREVQDLVGDFRRREHPVHQPGADGAARHAVELRALGRLHDSQAAVLFDRAHTARAVGAGARKHDDDRPLAALFRQRGEEDVDGMVEHPMVVVR